MPRRPGRRPGPVTGGSSHPCVRSAHLVMRNTRSLPSVLHVELTGPRNSVASPALHVPTRPPRAEARVPGGSPGRLGPRRRAGRAVLLSPSARSPRARRTVSVISSTEYPDAVPGPASAPNLDSVGSHEVGFTVRSDSAPRAATASANVSIERGGSPRRPDEVRRRRLLRPPCARGNRSVLAQRESRQSRRLARPLQARGVHVGDVSGA